MSLPHPMSGPLTSRRTALGGALAGLVAAAGCDDDAGSDEPPRSEPSAPPVDADAELVELAGQHIAVAWAAVSAARRENPQQRRSLRPLQQLHEAHLSALEVERDQETPSSPVAPDVRAVETTLQGQLTNAAVHAESGALAKVLASMAAAVAQQLAVLR